MTWTPSDHHDRRDAWVPCGTCWGQRTVFTTSAEHGRLVPSACPSCLGLGERYSEAGPMNTPTP